MINAAEVLIVCWVTWFMSGLVISYNLCIKRRLSRITFPWIFFTIPIVYMTVVYDSQLTKCIVSFINSILE